MPNIAILASGNGSNAERIITYFKSNKEVNIALIITNKEDAYVRKRAEHLNVPCLYFKGNQLKAENFLLKLFQSNNIDFVILAGYLLLIPAELIKEYPHKVINIHPALLPKYGGKGMYGINVHNAVIANNEAQSGISIHFVNENYDEGDIIFQAKTAIDKNDTPASLAEKIHLLEYEFFPKIIEKIILK